MHIADKQWQAHIERAYKQTFKRAIMLHVYARTDYAMQLWKKKKQWLNLILCHSLALDISHDCVCIEDITARWSQRGLPVGTLMEKHVEEFLRWWDSMGLENEPTEDQVCLCVCVCPRD